MWKRRRVDDNPIFQLFNLRQSANHDSRQSNTVISRGAHNARVSHYPNLTKATLQMITVNLYVVKMLQTYKRWIHDMNTSIIDRYMSVIYEILWCKLQSANYRKRISNFVDNEELCNYVALYVNYYSHVRFVSISLCVIVIIIDYCWIPQEKLMVLKR